ncbi:tRNA cyclic N6-threonylcarbamoyladenosine(37) synthase TcdA [Persicirhabdus sediminis]|uniref:tRNA cyclic N6-threonylcarbamoyladenosine(37) synthase TcdA n=1 Tax=Persicirhabdus sediminis TaxID=454144 RepID=A0A8J7SL42_9BACT|nr:tRNA cyclic N6-threonylcarbamoyladenosine(37) synthase TcdA [Persicirhabdus sediminis]MBK1790158.1 tRNA cyclic N6-threonylcarbamoyladenosine(37) synthase TcdA [Persicirhabdus sediminis]
MDPIWLERFGGIGRLYGEDELRSFSQAHVLVVGIGGVGSWVVEALARSGIGHITMIDLDEICVTNINRQLHAMDGEVGKQKTTAMRDRILAINPKCEVTCVEGFYSEKNSSNLLHDGIDYVIDAIDVIPPKAHLLAECVKANIPVITCGGAGGRRDPSAIRVGDLARTSGDSLLNQVRKKLRSQYGFPKGIVKGRAKKFHIEAIYSTEQPVYPTCDGGISKQKPNKESMRLNCASGFGSITHMTATFGLFAVSRCLNNIGNFSKPV